VSGRQAARSGNVDRFIGVMLSLVQLPAEQGTIG
jgi:hypothetical protein